MRSYLRVEWIHKNDYDPVLIYFDIDEEGWEERKIEIFRDGSAKIIGPDAKSAGIFLSEEKIPNISAIRRDSQFTPIAISKEEFYDVYNKLANKKP